MTDTSHDAALLVAELLTRKYLPRTHPRVRRALTDTELFSLIEQRLAQVGLRWVDNVYADHVSIALQPAHQTVVLGEAGLNANNNLDLPRDAMALLVVVCASDMAEGKPLDDVTRARLMKGAARVSLMSAEVHA